MKEIRARDLHRKWMKGDPAYAREFKALAGEFALASALVEARARRPDPGAARTTHEDHRGRGRAPGKRPCQALDAHLGALRRGDRHAVAHLVRACDSVLKPSAPGLCVIA